MEGIVAKRTLRKSYYNKNTSNVDYNNLYFSKENKKEKSKIVKLKEKWLYKVCIQAITMISIIAFVLAVKFLNIEIVLKSDMANKVITYYNTSYSIQNIISGGKSLIKTGYVFVKPIIPDGVKSKAKDVYKMLIVLKDRTKNSINVDNKEVDIYEENSNINKENKTKENIGVSADVVNDEEKVVAVSSSISSNSSLLEKIKATKIEFVKPLSGVITSHFGAREVIFEGIESYHTGTDIAANTGTKIVSSIEGKVTRSSYNEYNGNFVEVTNGDIATIYCHMSKRLVKVGDKVKAGTKIGEVGSTGLSTGPHLHFEIVYDGTKIDPEQVLKL